MDILLFLAQTIGISLSGVMAPGAVTSATIALGLRQRHSGAWIAIGHGIVELPLICLISLGAAVFFENPAVKLGIGLVGGIILIWMGLMFLKDASGYQKPSAELADHSAEANNVTSEATDTTAQATDGTAGASKVTAETTEVTASKAENPPPPESAAVPSSAHVDNQEQRDDSQATSNEPTGIRGPLWVGISLSAANPYFLLWWATVGLALAREARALGIIAFGVFAVVHWLCDLVWLEILSWTSFHGSRLFSRRFQLGILVICGVAQMLFGGWFLADAIRSMLEGPLT